MGSEASGHPPFDGTGTGQTASWLDTGVAGVAINRVVDSLTPDAVYHWRVRLIYHPATTPFQGFSRWLRQPWNGWQEANQTDLCNVDADGDGLQEGTELGYTPIGVGPEINLDVFVSDLDPLTTIDSLDVDSDDDGVEDGTEDANHNGRVDSGETNPKVKDEGTFYIIPSKTGGDAVLYLE